MDPYEAADLAKLLIATHAPAGWSFAFDRALRRCGRCSYSKKLITLSIFYTRNNDEACVRDTIMHEIAHALTPGSHHGWAWKAKALSLGARPERCKAMATMPERLFVGKCSGCNLSIKRHRRRKLQCLKCRLPITWHINQEITQ